MDHIVAITKNDKQELATQKVNLSKMDDVQDAISTAYAMKDAFEEAYDDAQVLVIKASDIIRFDWSDAITEAEGYMDELESAIKEFTNIIGGEFLSSISNLMNYRLLPKIPELFVGKGFQIKEKLRDSIYQESDDILYAKTEIFIDGEKIEHEIYLLFQ